MSSFADTQTLDGSDESYSVPENQPKRSWLQRVRDWLWGYDFFVSYHWASGGPYAVNLAQRLRDAKYDVFLDRAEYAMGDDWKKVGAYALSNTQRLILVATLEAVTDSKPVEREVQLFTSKNRQIIPIVFGDDLQELDWKKLEVLSLMEDSMLRISEDVHNLASGPSDAAIDQLVKTHGLMRRRTLRRWIISLLITLISVSAIVALFQRQVAVEEARKANVQLAKNYMRQGIQERDINEDFLKASHYLLQAAVIGDKAKETRISMNSRIIAEATSRMLPINWGQFDLGVGEQMKGALYSQFNGRLFAWSGRGAQLWDVATRKVIDAQILYDSKIDDALLSKDEKWILTWTSPGRSYSILGTPVRGANGIARIWDTRSGDPLSDPMLHDEGVEGARFSHDQNRVLTWEWNTMHVWDSRTGNALSRPMKHTNKVLGAKFSDDQKVILSWTASLSGGSGGMARVWDSCNGDLISGPIEHEYGIDGGYFSQDQQRVLTWDRYSAKVWDYTIESPASVITIHLEDDRDKLKSIKSAWLTKNDQQIVTWGATHYQVWDSYTGIPLSKPKEHWQVMFDALISEDKKQKLSRIFDALISEERKQKLISKEKKLSRINDRIIRKGKRRHKSADHQQRITWSTNKATIWGIPASESRPFLAFKGRDLNSLRSADVLLAQNQRWVLTWYRGSTGRGARIWDSYTGDPLSEWITHDQFTDEAPSWGFGKIQLRENRYGDKSIIDTTGRRSTRDGPRINQDQHLGMSLIWKAMGESLEVRNARTEKLLFDPITHKGGILDVLVTQDRKRGLIWGSRHARVWDFSTGEPLSAPMKHGDDLIDGVQFSNDQLRVLTWGGRTAQIWDSYTGQALFAPMVHKHDVNGAMFTNDGQRVLTWSKNGMVRIWNLEVDFDFPLQHLGLQLEVKSRRRVAETGDEEVVTHDEWSMRWAEYESIARKHLEHCQYPCANWYIDRMLHQPGSCEQPGDWLGDVNKDRLDEVKEIYASHCEERGRTLLLGGHYQQAKRSFETALILKPKNVFAHEGLARILIESGEDPYKGVEYAKQSLELNTRQAPKYALATLVKGYTLTGQDHKAALAGLKLARSFFLWGEYQHALDAYNQVFNTQPELREQLDPDECKKALEMLPKFMRTKEDVGALEIMFSKDLQTGFNARRAGKLAGNLIDREIDISKGIAYARRSLELDPEQPVNFAITILARGYIKQGRHEEAINILENALETASKREDREVLSRALRRTRAADKASSSDETTTQESSAQPKVSP